MTRKLVLLYTAVIFVSQFSCILAADDKPLLPYAVGNRWEYKVTDIGVMSVGEGPTSRSAPTEAEGTYVIEIMSIKEERSDGGIVYREREVETMDAGLNTRATEVVTEGLSLVTRKGVYCLAQQSSGLDGALSGQWEKYDPPLVTLEGDLSPGKRWKIGTIRDGDIRVTMESRVLGRETVETPAGVFEDCWKLCGTSNRISGTMGSGDDKAAIKDGKYVHYMWLYPGVGVVREEIFTQMKMAHKAQGKTLIMTGTDRETKLLLPGYRADWENKVQSTKTAEANP